MSGYSVVDAEGQTLATFDSWAAAARFQTSWERANLRPATVAPYAAPAVMLEARSVENSRPVVALIRLIGYLTSAPSRKAARSAA